MDSTSDLMGLSEQFEFASLPQDHRQIFPRQNLWNWNTKSSRKPGTPVRPQTAANATRPRHQRNFRPRTATCSSPRVAKSKEDVKVISIGQASKVNKEKPQDIQHFASIDTTTNNKERCFQKPELSFEEFCSSLDEEELKYQPPRQIPMTSSKVSELNYENKVFSRREFKSFSILLTQPTSTIRSLTLANSDLGDYYIGLLCSCLLKSSSIVYLDLRRNNIGTRGASKIANVLVANSRLQSLDLGWNNIRAEGLDALTRGLASNRSLQHLNLSWNPLNTPEHFRYRAKSQAFSNFCRMLSMNSSLFHLVLEHNNFSFSDCQHLAKNLMKNSTLILHFKGKYGLVNSFQFLIPKRGRDTESHEAFALNYDEGSLTAGMNRPTTSCWYCNQWIEYKWEFRCGPPTCDYSVHFDFEDFEAQELTKAIRLAPDGQTVHEISRVVPTNVPIYFYLTSSSASTSEKILDPNFQVEKWKGEEEMNKFYIPSKFPGVNPCLNDQLPIPCRNLYPRTKLLEPISSQKAWDIDTSIFISRRSEKPLGTFFNLDEVITQAFEIDWELTKIDRLIKDSKDLNALKEEIRPHYHYIITVFRYYCLIGKGNYGDCFNMGLLEFTDFCLQCQIPDAKCRLTDLDRIFIAVNVELTSQEDNQDNAIERFELLEALVRLSLVKFPAKSPSESFDNLMRKNIYPKAQTLDGDKFRRENFYCEVMDQILREQESSLRQVFDQASVCRDNFVDKRRVNRKTKYLMIESLVELVEKSGVACHRRDFNQALLNSKLILPNVLGTSSRMWISWMEYLEFLTRMAQTLDMTPDEFLRLFLRKNGIQQSPSNKRKASILPSLPTQHQSLDGIQLRKIWEQRHLRR